MINPVFTHYLVKYYSSNEYLLKKYSISYKTTGLGVSVSLTLHYLVGDEVLKIKFSHGYGSIEFSCTGSDILYRSPIGKAQYDSNLKKMLYDTVALHQNKTFKKGSRFTETVVR